jgi:hypothetical protein
MGYGYLDSWHGVATLFLLVPYVWGMARTHRTLRISKRPGSILRPSGKMSWRTAAGLGRCLLLATASGMVMGGTTIMIVGMTTVFVPQDLAFMELNASDLHRINPRLLPLIAHDRAGFGGGVASAGLIFLFCVWCGRPSRSLWQALLLAGGVGFVCAIGIHPLIGYTDFVHLAPAYFGALMFLAGLVLSRRQVSEA